MSRFFSKALFLKALAAFTFFCAVPAFAADEYAVPGQMHFMKPASPVMERLVAMHDHFMLYIITGVALLVLALLVYICLRFNEKSNPVASKTTHNTLVEIIWTVAPIIILVAIAIPSLRLHYYMAEMQGKADVNLKVLAHQWYWEYEYPDYKISYESRMVADKDLKPGQPRLLTVDNDVVVPVNAKVHVQMTSADVIHSWAMPSFGVKKDAEPGKLNDTWFTATRTGTFHGQCSELCGVDHGFMPITVRVVEQAEFDAWVAEQKKTASK